MAYADYEWYIKEDLSKYSGKWLAIINKNVVACNKDVKKLVKQVKNIYPNNTPLITKVNTKLSIL